ncbi:MAG: hypothetical protein ACD_77C00506G0006 [uncultured bacterium]|nr:MAG: hypothetical protein ACD_77C00506G0006 [uncultured bacterium]
MSVAVPVFKSNTDLIHERKNDIRNTASIPTAKVLSITALPSGIMLSIICFINIVMLNAVVKYKIESNSALKRDFLFEVIILKSLSKTGVPEIPFTNSLPGERVISFPLHSARSSSILILCMFPSRGSII